VSKLVYRDPEWLRVRYIDHRMTMVEIAEEAGCLPETVFYWLRKHRIPTRTRAEALRTCVDKACEQCGAPMSVKPAVLARGFGKFCSRACKHEAARRLTADEIAQHVKARELLNTAISTGRIHRPDTCEGCGTEEPVDGHHHDYAKPYDVEWLCNKCHGARHRQNAA
jgi:hypothetical protein